MGYHPGSCPHLARLLAAADWRLTELAATASLPPSLPHLHPAALEASPSWPEEERLLFSHIEEDGLERALITRRKKMKTDKKRARNQEESHVWGRSDPILLVQSSEESHACDQPSLWNVKKYGDLSAQSSPRRLKAATIRSPWRCIRPTGRLFGVEGARDF